MLKIAEIVKHCWKLKVRFDGCYAASRQHWVPQHKWSVKQAFSAISSGGCLDTFFGVQTPLCLDILQLCLDIFTNYVWTPKICPDTFFCKMSVQSWKKFWCPNILEKFKHHKHHQLHIIFPQNNILCGPIRCMFWVVFITY